ncbi:MAG TPA: helicase HerA-like domain-containing protein, partial [Rhodanobacteraceae bacterium]
VRLIRSKGVGVYFVTQNPSDVPEIVLGQLGNRVQHALRAFTPRDQKAVKAAAETLRVNPSLDIKTAITELAVGEALVSFLDEKGSPRVTQRAWIAPPASRIGPITQQERDMIQNDAKALYGHYTETVDRESAYEKLKTRTGEKQGAAPAPPASTPSAPQPPATSGRTSPWKDEAPAAPDQPGAVSSVLSDILFGTTGPRGGHHEGLAESAARSAARSIGSGFGRAILRGALGSILGSSSRSRR